MTDQKSPDQNNKLPDQPVSGNSESRPNPEYQNLLSQWLFLDRGDNSLNSAHAHHASFLSID